VTGKKKKILLLSIILPIAAVIAVAVVFVTVHGVRVTKTWSKFSEKRIEKLEEIFSANFPENAEFEFYSSKFWIGGYGDIHTIYIKNIADPESFCRNNFNTSVSFTFMADIKNSEVIVNEFYSEIGVEEFLKKDKENWITEERTVDFLGHAINHISEDSFYIVEMFFSPDGSGNYDVKLIAEVHGKG